MSAREDILITAGSETDKQWASRFAEWVSTHFLHPKYTPTISVLASARFEVQADTQFHLERT